MIPKFQHLFLDHSTKFFFVDYLDPELFCLVELAPRFFPGQEIACFLAHAAAHFSTAADNHFRDFVARLTQCPGDNPRRLSEW